ncbi:MAG: S41 family peptidase [Acidobacteriota bacterium]
MKHLLIVLPLLISLVLTPSSAQALDPATQDRILDTVADTLVDRYVDLEIAEAMVAAVNASRERYHALNSPRAFVEAVNRDLFSVSNDLHVQLIYSEPGRETLFHAEDNYDFIDARTLPGNIGYLRLDAFSTHDEARATAEAALAFLAGTEALIVDLRFNGGGSGELVTLMLSYFIDRPTVIAEYHYRWNGNRSAYKTHRRVAGEKRVGTPLYVLVGPHTASAAEIFADTVQSFDLGELVGERTWGLGNVADFAVLEAGVSMIFTHGEGRNAKTGTNFAGTGLTPDLACPVDEALEQAHLAAFDHVGNEDDRGWTEDVIRARYHPIEPSPESLTAWVGAYGHDHIRLQDDGLVWVKEHRPAYPLTPVSDARFVLTHDPSHLMIELTEESMTLTYANGDRRSIAKTDPNQ